MKMAELERRSGVGREAIRYYIGLGLLPEPERPKRNVALYGDDHLARLAVIRRLREETWLPLAFIKTLLDRPAHGEAAPIAGLARLLGPRLAGAPEGPATPVADAARMTGLPLEEIETLIDHEILFADAGRNGARALSALDLAVASAWARVRAAGFSDEAGFFAEDARLYAETLAPLAAHEVDRFFTRLGGSLPPAAAAELAEAGVEQVNALMAAMRRNFIFRRVAELTAPATAPERRE